MGTHDSNEGVTLDKIAKVIRSKNSGPFEITMDIMFDNLEMYEHLKRHKVITADRVALAYNVPVSDVLVCKPFDAAMAFKIALRRQISSGDWGDGDVYGCQQHMPLAWIRCPPLKK